MSEQEKQAQDTQFSQQLRVGLAMTYNAIAFKKYKNSPVIIARDGKIVAVPADEMPPAPLSPQP
jgi:hypothetical protein